MPLSLMNRLIQTDSVVFKLWMLYFQRISFAVYFDITTAVVMLGGGPKIVSVPLGLSGSRFGGGGGGCGGFWRRSSGGSCAPPAFILRNHPRFNFTLKMLSAYYLYRVVMATICCVGLLIPDFYYRYSSNGMISCNEQGRFQSRNRTCGDSSSHDTRDDTNAKRSNNRNNNNNSYYMYYYMYIKLNDLYVFIY